MGLPTERSRAALHHCIRTEVRRLGQEPRLRPVLIVDEAQHLRSDVLEDLRLLTNYEMGSQNRLCLLLIGQAELRRPAGKRGAATRAAGGRPCFYRCSIRAGYGIPFQSRFKRAVFLGRNGRHSPQPLEFETGSNDVSYQPPVSPDSGLIDQ